jgi:hypothetical protein
MSQFPDPARPDDRGYEPGGYPVPAGGLPPRPPAPGARVGQVSGVQVRQESQYASSNASVAYTVLEFRLVEPGSPRPLDVLMRGRSLSGTVREGDWVELAGPPDVTGRWNVDRVQNLTTGSTVVVLGGRRSATAKVVGIALLVVIVVVAGLVIVGAVAALAGS